MHVIENESRLLFISMPTTAFKHIGSSEIEGNSLLEPHTINVVIRRAKEPHVVVLNIAIFIQHLHKWRTPKSCGRILSF